MTFEISERHKKDFFELKAASDEISVDVSRRRGLLPVRRPDVHAQARQLDPRRVLGKKS